MTLHGPRLLVPQPLEASPRHASVTGCMLRTVPQVVLDGAKIDASVGKGKATRVTQHVRVHVPETCALTSSRHN